MARLSREADRLYHRRYTESHLAKYRVYNKQSALRLKLEMIAAYGSKCSCCGITEHEFLTIDHVGCGRMGEKRWEQLRGGKLYRHLRRNGWPKNGYQLLCMNCNSALGYFGYCPHQKESANGSRP